MKTLQKTKLLVLILVLFISVPAFATEIEARYKAKNTVICMDIDDVVIKKTKGLQPSIVWALKTYPNGLLRARSHFQERDDNGHKIVRYKDDSLINGVTYQWLYCAIKNETFLPYIARIIEITNTYRELNKGTVLILRYLKEKGYPICFATNKDHYSFDQADRALNNELSKLADHVILCQPGNTTNFMEAIEQLSQQKNLPNDLKKLLIDMKKLKETDTIHYAPLAKPDAQYWKKLREVIDKKYGEGRRIIFFDDKKDNIKGINEYVDKKMKGYQFKDPMQFAQKLVELRIFNRHTDHILLQELEYMGFVGGVKRYWYQTRSFINFLILPGFMQYH